MGPRLVLEVCEVSPLFSAALPLPILSGRDLIDARTVLRP